MLFRSYGQIPERSRPPIPAPRPIRQRPAAPALELSEGDLVEHTAFGQGVVTAVQAMSGDAMITVQFEGMEKPKRLMLKFAGSHMKKLSS